MSLEKAGRGKSGASRQVRCWPSAAGSPRNRRPKAFDLRPGLAVQVEDLTGVPVRRQLDRARFPVPWCGDRLDPVKVPTEARVKNVTKRYHGMPMRRPKMRRSLLPLACGLWCLLAASASYAGRDTPSRAAAISPHGQIRVELSLAEHGRANGPARLFRLVSRPTRDPPIAAGDRPGRVASSLGTNRRSRRSGRRSIDETYTQHPGKRSRVDRTIARRPSSRSASDAPRHDAGRSSFARMTTGPPSGIGFPPRRAGTRLEIAGERTRFHLPRDAVAYALPLNGYHHLPRGPLPEEGRRRRFPAELAPRACRCSPSCRGPAGSP